MSADQDKINKGTYAPLIAAGVFFAVAVAAFFLYQPTMTVTGGASSTDSPTASGTRPFTYPPLDIAAYNAKLAQIANVPLGYVRVRVSSSSTSTILVATSTPSPWPVRGNPYPLGGAIFPFDRVVAYYGNFYSTQMGVLGEYPPDQMIQMLQNQAAAWQTTDTSTRVIPALDYIAVAAQSGPGPDGMYRLRMPGSQIQKALDLIKPLDGLVVLDVQIGLSTVEDEVPLLTPYLKLPNVELALDPEFSMRAGGTPGTRIGTMDAKDINWAIEYLAGIVKDNHLPPKFIVIHDFTNDMVTNSQDIRPTPEVQVVMDMDGFGTPAQKIKTYKTVIDTEPVQFTGFKLFYKNDILQPGSHLMTPAEVLQLSPQPNFIQYQ